VSGAERIRADDLVGTDAEREALERLRHATGEVDGPMERHGLRCFLICVKQAGDLGREVDREALMIAGLIHDIGLYDDASEGGVYVTDGRHFAERMLAGHEGWTPERLRLLGDAIERHHEVRSQWSAGAEVELMRRADMIELSSGLVNFGLDRGWIRGLWASVPRQGIYGEVGKMVAKALRERPSTVPRILIRGR
jgi:hypothetical protein